MFKSLKPSGLLSVIVLGSGNVMGMLISAVALILFSRYMGPSEFGLFSAAYAAMQIIVRLADFGTNMAAERAIARVHGQDSDFADSLMRVAFWFKLASFGFVATLAWFTAPWISSTLLHLNNPSIIHFAVVLSLGTIFFEYSTLVFQSTHRFGQAARIVIAQAIGKFIFGLIFMYLGILHAKEALVIFGLMPGVGALLGWDKNTVTTFKLPKTWKSDLYHILNVAKWTLIAGLAASLAENIDTLMVQSFMTSFDTGIWAGVGRIATFASVLGLSVGAVLNVRVAKYARHSDLLSYLQKTWKIALAIFVGLLLAIPLAGLAIQLTIGPAYLPGVVPLQILIVATAIAGAAIPFVALFYLFDRPEYYAYAGLIQITTLVIGDLLLIPRYGLMGASVVRVIMRFAVLAFTLLYVRESKNHYFKLKLFPKS
ncbi:MAG: oligosaccharide flippase family protein [Microgenomates group bacterium]